ncbi:4'-phosphopantetheinyl transferase family protein [Thalassomonas actiniarum]|uniref:4'-phosphopantetheinyl transferase superfamily protein n=1 Tax=Thalassomonas actiniarum TaxID=485447 RepID=A0AAE9YUP8_9GAMM|nr:4'-phosphopantetheinyl transferase superfamily protein [Thalassomonas actiniarum]WDE00665.1 4'-phosphopantetheinyl transferase superfamily protein [Thalassomonas actiniarum]
MEKLSPVTKDINAISLEPSLCLMLFDSNVLSQAHISELTASWLTADEKQILDRRRLLTAKKEFVASRGMIKLALARHFQLDVRSINIHFDQQDTCLKASRYQQAGPKEYQEVLPVQICISHSHGKVLVAMSRQSTRLGVDLEWRKPERPWLKLARHFYHARELTRIEREGVDSFYRTWTLKEALAKAIKQPIARLLSQDITPMLDPFTVISSQYQDFDISLITDLPSAQVELTVLNALF